MDGDGYPAASDCNDDAPEINPGATERCNQVDDDCDGEIDGADAIDAEDYYLDRDDDGFGAQEPMTTACTAPADHVADSSDCDDDAPSIHPGAVETCDGVDEDCDGDVDEDVVSIWYSDTDGDGFGDPDHTREQCLDPGDGWTSSAGDCDDFDSSINPEAIEICNDIDDDCDDTIDEDGTDGPVWYRDDDGDGFGDPASTLQACERPDGYTPEGTDCDDTDPATNPEGIDDPDNDLDEDCDGQPGELQVHQIAGGRAHSLGLRTNGTVTSWGENLSGQLGDGTVFQRTRPVPVQGLVDVIQVAAGYGHSLALKADGSVWAWGANDVGQVGQGSVDRSIYPWPMRVHRLSDVLMVQAGAEHSVALRSDGTVWTWGGNQYGQIGDSAEDLYPTPNQVEGLGQIVAIAAGGYHTLALEANGTVWAWGQNDNGQLGDGENRPHALPTAVQMPTGAVAIAAGAAHSLALTSDGATSRLLAWGENGYGQLGDGSTYDRNLPVSVLTLTRIRSVDAGANHSLAILADGTYWAWGNNMNGQRGDGTRGNQSPVPLHVTALDTALVVSAGGDHSMAVTQDGSLYAWGDNASGQLGDGTTTDRPEPVAIDAIRRLLGLVSGAPSYHTLALYLDGTVWAWGLNDSGQLGTGSTSGWTANPTPTRITSLRKVGALAAGYRHSLALKLDGTIWAWGNNEEGRLGDASTTNRSTPVQVVGITTAAAISAGYEFSAALLRDGTVRTWGLNEDYQLGDGTTNPQTTPVQVESVEGATAIACGGMHTLVIRAEASGQPGQLWAWGSNSDGQLGIGSNELQPTTPTEVAGLTDVSIIAAGTYHSLAKRTSDPDSPGSVWAWGNNGAAQIGNGSVGGIVASPTEVEGLPPVTKLAAGYYNSYALCSADVEPGEVWSWGSSNYGQIGDGSTTYKTTPVLVESLSDVVSVTAGDSYACAHTDDGTAYGWGLNGFGQIGAGASNKGAHPLPVQIPGLP